METQNSLKNYLGELLNWFYQQYIHKPHYNENDYKIYKIKGTYRQEMKKHQKEVSKSLKV